MILSLDINLARHYKSPSQRIRVLTEKWVDNQVYCPNCGQIKINKYINNRPVADFYCPSCREDYELKSKHTEIGTKILDGAYYTMIDRLQSSNNPNFFLLNYDVINLEVKNFFVIPKHFFVPEIIEKRKALSLLARRAGWIGCNILLESIPQMGKIYFIKNRKSKRKEDVLAEWQKTLFLRDEKEIPARGWLLDTMRIIEKVRKKDFNLEDLYRFEEELSDLHPQNKHIKDKIRQQLQILREKGYLEFTIRGHYRLI